jgi:hypothetical protein
LQEGKELRKKLIPVICLILAVLPFSFTDCALPNVEVKASIGLPIRIAANDWGKAVANTLQKAFYNKEIDPGEEALEFSAEVYDVNYADLEEQTFLIHLHSEMSDSLDPSDYLEKIEFLKRRDGNSDDNYKIDSTIDPSLLQKITLPVIQSYAPYLGGSGPILFNVPPSEIPLGVDEGFLRAKIAEGSITIDMELYNGSTSTPPLAESSYNPTYNIRLEQDTIQKDVPYEGLSCDIGPLNGQFINHNDINVGGNISLQLTGVPFSSALLIAELSITINVEKIESLDWLIDKIIPQIKPVSFEKVTPYVNHIVYEEGEIGVQFDFEETIDGIEMALECEALELEGDVFQQLVKNTPVKFSNNRHGTLWLNYCRPDDDPEGPEGPEEYDPLPFMSEPLEEKGNELDFKLVLQGNRGSVLHIENPEAPLRIKGTAVFFHQNWERAQLNMIAIIKAAPDEDTGKYMGSIPNKKDNDPLNLSVLTKYIEGFTFTADTIARMHVRGPSGVIENNQGRDERPTLKFGAEFLWDDPTNKPPKEDIYSGKLELKKEEILIPSSDLNIEKINEDRIYKTYTKKTLPSADISFDISPGFLKVMNHHPQKLYFNYDLGLPDVLTVYPEDFDDDGTLQKHITTTIMIMLHLKLFVAGPGPGIIKVPELFKESPDDLFGRESLEEESIFDSIEIDHLKLSIDFIEPFFEGGVLYLEQEGNRKKIFPNGIKLDGIKTVIYISRDENPEINEIIKDNLIAPEFRVVFEEKDKTITVPRNIGLDNIKLEVKGKYEFLP